MTEQRHVEYLFQLWNGELLLVTAVDVLADPYGYYESFRLHVGPEGDLMERLDVLGADRLKDGGTTWVYTAGAELFSPSPSKRTQGRQHGPTWDEHPVAELRPEDYSIDEPEHGPAVVRRIAAAVGSLNAWTKTN